MKVVYKKRKGIDVYDVYADNAKTKYSVSKQGYLTDIYYLIYYGKRFCGRFKTIKETQEYIAVKLLDSKADLLLEKK